MTARHRVLFGRERYTAEFGWTDLAGLLPGWEIRVSPPRDIAAHLDGVAAVCPFGARIDKAVLEAGTFGLVQQFGVGLESVDITRATELGVWVARVPGDAGGNADSVADLAVLFLLALARRFDEARDALLARRWEQRPTGWVAGRQHRAHRRPRVHRRGRGPQAGAVRRPAARRAGASRARRAARAWSWSRRRIS